MAVNTKKLIQGYINMTKYLMSKTLTILKNTPAVTMDTLKKVDGFVAEFTNNIKNPNDIAKRLIGAEEVGNALGF